MTEHDKAIGYQRFTPVAAPIADRLQGVPNDMLAEIVLQFVDAFDGRDAADTTGALVNIRHVVFGFDTLRDPAMGNGIGPLAKHIEIADIFHLVDLVCAGRPGANLTKHDFTIRLAIPLHVGETGVELQGLDDIETHLYTILSNRGGRCHAAR